MTIGPLIPKTIIKRSVGYTAEENISSRWNDWGSDHETVYPAAGEFARDDGGDGFCAGPVTTFGGVLVVAAFVAPSPSWDRQEKLPRDVGFFAFVQNVRVDATRCWES